MQFLQFSHLPFPLQFSIDLTVYDSLPSAWCFPAMYGLHVFSMMADHPIIIGHEFAGDIVQVGKEMAG